MSYTDEFKKKGSILVKDVFLREKIVDIFIDELGKVRAIGDRIRKEYGSEAAVSLNGNGAIVLPGLTNTHTHAAMALFRGYADDMPLEDWLQLKIWPLEAHLTGNEVYWGTKLACLEMIKTGTLSFNDMYFFMKDAARAVDEMGLKAVLAYGFIDLFEETKREQEIKATEDFCRYIRTLGNPRIKAAVGPHAIYTVSQEALKWMGGVSQQENVGIHIHLSETETEVKNCIAENGLRPAQFLDTCGVLTPRTVAAHCCWLDEAECALLGQRGVHVSHTPQSNMKLAVNRALPYPLMKKYHVNMTLGTDGCASNNNLDLFEVMKFSALLQKFAWNSPVLLPAQEAIAMATSHGAKALGFEPTLIQEGANADIILVSRQCVCNTPLHNIESNIVYACNGNAVTTVICDGRVLMHERCIPEEKEIIKGATKAADDVLKKAIS